MRCDHALIDKLAQLGDPKAVSFTKPKLDGKLKFSFSGIKTAVFYYLEKKKEMTEKERQDLCASFQETVVSWVVEKTLTACEMTESKIVVTGGGVTANSLLRKRLTQEAEKKGIKVFIPPLKYTTDNAAMIARNGYEKHMKFKLKTQEVIANPNLGIGRSAA